MSSNLKIEKTCVFCKETYIAKTLLTKYCSHKCNSRHYKQRKREEKIETFLNPPQVTTNSSTISIADKEFLSIIETSVLIGISIRTVHRLMKNESLKFSKIGRRTIISRNSVNKLLNQDYNES
ncbi:helix-turn-helix domain-containing protein [Flavobacterium columnare]|uniref:DNA-binding protein n=1 Tax=Flavobacterium columnare TaxID=996 RepID=A0AA94F2G1_9FLAO|nr:helix-turn-helix domain-containing protein [Flavobacterium columnare]MCH4830602.1 helix-turn-helix domain-containing protein [Flavobacterium columnare]MCH4833461.1 helix-turn-helix domain-containing protein [Flavobacterium columnare]